MGQPTSPNLLKLGSSASWIHLSDISLDRYYYSHASRLSFITKILFLLFKYIVCIPKLNPWLSNSSYSGWRFTRSFSANSLVRSKYRLMPKLKKRNLSYFRHIPSNYLGENEGSPVFSIGFSYRIATSKSRFVTLSRSIRIGDKLLLLIRICNPRLTKSLIGKRKGRGVKHNFPLVRYYGNVLSNLGF